MIPEFSNAETRVKPLAYVRLSYYWNWKLLQFFLMSGMLENGQVQFGKEIGI
jgi:hypothetical protein